MLIRISWIIIVLGIFPTLANAGLLDGKKPVYYAGANYMMSGCNAMWTDPSIPELFAYPAEAPGKCYGAGGGAQLETPGGGIALELNVLNFSPTTSAGNSITGLAYGVKVRKNTGLARGQYRYNGIYTVTGLARNHVSDTWDLSMGAGYRTIMGLLIDVEYMFAFGFETTSYGTLRTGVSYVLPF